MTVWDKARQLGATATDEQWEAARRLMLTGDAADMLFVLAMLDGDNQSGNGQ